MVPPSVRYSSLLTGRVFAALCWKASGLLCSCCLSAAESKQHFLLMRTVLRAEEGWERGPTLPFQLENFWLFKIAKNALRKSPTSPCLPFLCERGAAS